jgi:hypothetical protein
MTDPNLTPPTFEEAIALSQSLINHLDTLPEPEIQKMLSRLVGSENGARGFFVTYLTDDRPFADAPSEGVVKALQSSPVIVAELLVKNLAMSAAMAIAHRRNQDEAMAQGSDRVQRRTVDLIQRVKLAEVSQKAIQLRQSAITGSGAYESFLERWGYDAEQRQQIEQVMGEAIVMP